MDGLTKIKSKEIKINEKGQVVIQNEELAKEIEKRIADISADAEGDIICPNVGCD